MAISDMLKRDSYILGVILALLIPVLAAFIFLALNHLVADVLHGMKAVNDNGIILLSIGMNLIAMRYYLVKLSMDKTGKAILALTFVMGILFFIFLHGKEINLLTFN
ncbi:MAG TPA: hypothetical protein PK796_03080 [Bacteroidales bacterium]|jgi:hypothetical protein|nr:hypothetical protein [Bacteroidales bacterium]